jgi:hypothetical protein
LISRKRLCVSVHAKQIGIRILDPFRENLLPLRVIKEGVITSGRFPRFINDVNADLKVTHFPAESPK